jgi:hypothetical protein
VLKGFDARRFETSLVIVEHAHLSRAARDECVALMRFQGLTPAVGFYDSYFYRAEVFGQEIADFLAPFQQELCAARS